MFRTSRVHPQGDSYMYMQYGLFLYNVLMTMYTRGPNYLSNNKPSTSSVLCETENIFIHLKKYYLNRKDKIVKKTEFCGK